MEVLNTYNLSIGYKEGKKLKEIMSDLNISLNEGELVCLLGANGTGKSTLLRTLSGVLSPISGSITINGDELSSISKRKLSKLLSLVYTDRTNAGALTVKELVELGRQPHTGFFGKLDAEDNIIVESAMKDAGILDKKDSFVSDLSDGERQKAMIARALAQATPIIFLDEPTAFLDVASKVETMKLLHDLAKKHNKAILLSSHDISQALSLADKLWIIDKTETLIHGITEDLIISKKLHSLFDSKRINFDSKIGQFLAKEEYNAEMLITGDDELLLHWLENFLKRNGIKPIRNKKTTPSIRIVSKDNIEFCVNDENKQILSSFYELTKVLARYFN